VGKTTASPLADLRLFHRNPRRGDVSAIAASLRAHGQYKPITANIGTHTGRPNEVLAGNHTLMAFRDLAETYPTEAGWASILVHWVDVDDDMCNRIVTADNQIGRLGGFDAAELVALLDDIGDINGLGFTDADVDDLRAILEETDPFADGGVAGDPDDGDAGPSKPILDPDNGLIDVKDIETNATEYADTTNRMIVMSLPIPQFIWAQGHLDALRRERGLDTNSDLLLSMLADLTGDIPPDADATVAHADDGDPDEVDGE
jgi:hypothetical protein